MTDDEDMANTIATGPAVGRKGIMRFLPLLVIGTGAVVGFVFLKDYLSFDALKDNREALLAWRDGNYLLAATVYVLLYVLVVAFSLPGAAVMTLTGGFLFGLFGGTLLTVFGATLGATCIFLAAKTSLGDSLKQRAGPWMEKFEKSFQENEISFLFFLRLVPAVPFFIANLLPAFFGVSLPTYVWTTFLGILPGTAVYTSVGTGLGEIFAKGGSIADALSDPWVWGPLLALSLLSLLPIIIKKMRGKPPLLEATRMSETLKVDLCVIGAGSGGLSVAAGAVQMGASVVLIETGEMGGDCLNYGCVPSKALLAAGKAAHAHRAGAKFGVAADEPTVDFAAVNKHVKGVIAGIAPHDSQERFEGLGCTVIREAAKFTGPTTVEAGGQAIEARRIIIATGSSPFVPPIEGLETTPYFTNETIFDNTELPERLIVVGGGPIGMEMAQAHKRLGSEVVVLEGAKALGKDDPELTAIALDNLRAEGLDIREDAMAERVAHEGGKVQVHLKGGEVVEGTHLLMAVGRKANVDGLDLEKAGIEYTRRGITVGENLKTSNSKVYAIGDVTGGLQFTHVAGYHAGVVIRSALFRMFWAKATTHHIPWVTYIDPEIAQVGMTEKQATEKYGSGASVLRFEANETDRAQAERTGKGLIKVVVKGSRIIGASIVGKGAGEMIHLWAYAIANKQKIGSVAGYVAPYPTLGEASKRVAGSFYTPKLFSDRTRKIVRFLGKFG